MIKPELFDLVELLVNLPKYNQFIGSQGTIVECFGDGKYEVEFSNEEGETAAIFSLSPQQFIVVWQAQTKIWLSLPDKINEMINHLPKNQQQELFNFARFLHQVTPSS